MPFDATPITETKPDVFSLEGLVAWLERQPAETEYDWPSVEGCLICRYLQANGAPSDPQEVPTWSYQHGDGYDSVFRRLADYLTVGGDLPWTYGAALDRARKLLASG